MTKIITAPNPVLSEASKSYVFQKTHSTRSANSGQAGSGQGDKFLPGFLKDMEETLLEAHDPKGVGLAAPQVGRSVSIFMAKPTEKSKIFVFINPKILSIEQNPNNPNLPNLPKQKPKKVKKLEGCLSLPSIWGYVKRAPVVTLSYFDPRGVQRTKKFTGFMATIIQHEVDHLHGILFPRRVLEQKGKLYKSTKNEKGEDEFEEIEI